MRKGKSENGRKVAGHACMEGYFSEHLNAPACEKTTGFRAFCLCKGKNRYELRTVYLGLEGSATLQGRKVNWHKVTREGGLDRKVNWHEVTREGGLGRT